MLALLLSAGCVRSGFDSEANNPRVDAATTSAPAIDASTIDASATDASTTDGRTADAALLDASALFLTGLVPSQGELTPFFSTDTQSYTITVSLWVENMTFIPTAPGGATITVNGQPVISGNASQSLALALGSTLVTILVDAGGPTRTYTVDVQRADGVMDYLKASNSGVDDWFGLRISLSGDTLAVGARWEGSSATGVGGDEADNSAEHSGAVYIFVRMGTTWIQEAYLKASNTEAFDWFGHSVSLSGDTLAVGVPEEASSATGVGGDQADNSAEYSGAVYIFTRTGTTWSQEAYLKASNTDAYDYFGDTVSLSGDTVAVGAWGEASHATGVGGDETDNTLMRAGAVYVFTRTGTTWSQQAYLKASNTGEVDSFGWSISLSGDTLAVGAIREDSGATGVDGDGTDNSTEDSGAVYIFTRTETTWSQEAYLKASNTDADDRFGLSVSLSGGTLAVGAPGEDSSATGVGGDEADNTVSESGAVYFFTRAGAIWNQQAYLKASNPDAFDYFGWSVSSSGDKLAVTAYGEGSSATGVGGDEADNTAFESGAVYIFTRTWTFWNQQAYLKASNTDADDRFGLSVSMSGDMVAVGAYFEDSSATGVGGDEADNSTMESGAVYVFP